MPNNAEEVLNRSKGHYRWLGGWVKLSTQHGRFTAKSHHRRRILAPLAHNRARNDPVHHQCDTPKLPGPNLRPRRWSARGSTSAARAGRDASTRPRGADEMRGSITSGIYTPRERGQSPTSPPTARRSRRTGEAARAQPAARSGARFEPWRRGEDDPPGGAHAPVEQRRKWMPMRTPLPAIRELGD